MTLTLSSADGVPSQLGTPPLRAPHRRCRPGAAVLADVALSLARECGPASFGAERLRRSRRRRSSGSLRRRWINGQSWRCRRRVVSPQGPRLPVELVARTGSNRSGPRRTRGRTGLGVESAGTTGESPDPGAKQREAARQFPSGFPRPRTRSTTFPAPKSPKASRSPPTQVTTTSRTCSSWPRPTFTFGSLAAQ